MNMMLLSQKNRNIFIKKHHAIQMFDIHDQGATAINNGVNFSIYSENAKKVSLLLFKNDDDKYPEIIDMKHIDKNIWNTFVSGIGPGTLYGYKIDGDYKPENGSRYNKNKLLIDPYAKALSRPVISNEITDGYKINDELSDLSFDENDDTPIIPKSYVYKDNFDWKGVDKPEIPWKKTIIYETHVKGITQLRNDIPENLRGTYSGLASDNIINYLKDLGITAIELLPVQQKIDYFMFDGKKSSDYWGYNTINFFSPDVIYSVNKNFDVINEFKNMVKKFHENNIEVIMDVVYNHTAEGNHLGPTLSFKGIDNNVYYKLEKDKRYYVNFTGTGNTINIGHPQVLKMVKDSLIYFSEEMKIDGFRFDLAPILGRKTIHFNNNSSFFNIVHSDNILSKLKLIAEPWDIGPYGYQLGNFPMDWSEWNGRYRDSIRSFWKNNGHNTNDFASRFSGSSDIFYNKYFHSSINFITCHDGFTLNDLVSYINKHNEINGNNNNDGSNHNISVNFGFEGKTNNVRIINRRNVRIKSLLISLLTSYGVPMILGGDEIKRTQNGNNNAYNQDNEISWYDWNLNDDQNNILDFTKNLIKIRKEYCVFNKDLFSLSNENVKWLKPDGTYFADNDWHTLNSIEILLINNYKCNNSNSDIIIIFNPTRKKVNFKLPQNYKNFITILDSVNKSWDYNIYNYNINALPGASYIIKCIN